MLLHNVAHNNLPGSLISFSLGLTVIIIICLISLLCVRSTGILTLSGRTNNICPAGCNSSDVHHRSDNIKYVCNTNMNMIVHIWEGTWVEEMFKKHVCFILDLLCLSRTSYCESGLTSLWCSLLTKCGGPHSSGDCKVLCSVARICLTSVRFYNHLPLPFFWGKNQQPPFLFIFYFFVCICATTLKDLVFCTGLSISPRFLFKPSSMILHSCIWVSSTDLNANHILLNV